jgi:DNA-binding XRE family transcriptional regulator
MTKVHLVLTTREVLGFENELDVGETVAECRRTLTDGGTFVVQKRKTLQGGPILDLGKRIAEAREARGLTQADLANRVARSPSWLSQIERGVRRLDRVSVINQLAEVLDIDFGAEPAANPGPDEWIVVPAASVHLVRVFCSAPPADEAEG